jgi:DNA polymerase-1
MVGVSKYIEENNLSKDVSMILQIHDELIFEIKKGVEAEVIPEILKIMENVIPENETAGVPIIVKAEVGPDWGNLKAQ